MKAYQLIGHNSLDALKLVDLPGPKVVSNDVLVRIHANSMNYWELVILRGGYARNQKIPVIPVSDGASEVVEIGENVTAFKVGDRVAGTFFRDWVQGAPTEDMMNTALGGGIDGMLASYVALPEHAWVKIPEHLTYEEAATLPCAAVTAWNSLTTGGLIPGQTVLTLGTGGVSIFALQFAKLFGAKVIITSSSDEKLERTRALGADETINYRTNPEWQEIARSLTDGIGVDQVVEVGGEGTFSRSLSSARMGGYIGTIGVLTGFGSGGLTPASVFFNHLRVQGIYVGSREMFEAMIKAISLHRLLPVIDETIPFAEVKRAYELLEKGKHFGKIVISHS
ncbi:NAD(P)-dependent alcohol dehydrogenase [Calothrix sp. HK-06]|nr:NAD(P)-dependent alcohol dehydrogenase [Calothrix sp. HK-06]